MSISSVSSNMAGMQMHGMRQRPDPAQMAEKLFDKLDTSGQGYLQKADFQSAFENLGTSSSSATTNVDDLFTQLDSDSDGKVTKDEFSSSLQKLADQLDQQFQSMRMQGGMGGMPPPPPPNDAGFTKDELSSQLEAAGSSDSQRSSLISSVVENFDAADTDGNGKVSFQEAMAFEQSQSSASSGATGNASDSTAPAADDIESRVMQQIMKLLHAYGASGGDSAATSSGLSVSA